MGSRCRLVVGGGPETLIGGAQQLIHRLERTWSRFVASSEICQLNRNAGQLTIVSAATYELIERAAAARELTGGRFNPLMLTQLTQLGYCRPWQLGGPSHPRGETAPGSQQDIELFPEIPAVRLPEGTAFDPGGIGKGLAVDYSVDFLAAEGATTILVELGGDLRVHGQCWYGPQWRVGIANPFEPAIEIASFTPDRGAVTTSSTLRRNWSTGRRRLHHLLDPTTGLPSGSDVVAVTTCAGTAWWSEVAAKTALMAGSANAIDLLAHYGVTGMAVTADGTVLKSADGAVLKSADTSPAGSTGRLR